MIRYCYEYETSKMNPENVNQCFISQQVMKFQVPSCQGSQKTEDNCLIGTTIQEEMESFQESELQGNFNQEPEQSRDDKITYENDSFGVEPSGLRQSPNPYHAADLVKTSFAKGHVAETNKDHEWNVVKVKQVLISSIDQLRKPYLPRSVSLSEKELREAKVRSQKIAAQLTTPPSTSSRGVQLFNRRKQRVNSLTSEGYRTSAPEVIARDKEGVLHHDKEDSLKRTSLDKALLKTLLNSENPGLQPVEDNMEENMAERENFSKKEHLQDNEDKGEEILSKKHIIQSNQESFIEEVKNIPVSIYVKDNIAKTSTNATFDNKTCDQETTPFVNKEQNGVPKKQYCEVHLTLAKPVSVANRSAKPFGMQSPAKIKLSTDRSPVIDLPPPPTYAETLSSPPPVSSVKSPPSYSVLYPTPTKQKPHVPHISSYGEKKSMPMQKSGILEDSLSRRSNKKSMFTFVEKPKLSPNPELLSLVHNTDEKRKQRDHGEAIPEEEPFALGAEASNFLNDGDGTNPASADTVPEWSSCLKSPSFQAKPPPKPNQTLSEAKGKGAELFARRQSRMERFVIESPAHHDSARSPSPTMSLPPSWKYASNAHMPPVAFSHLPKKLSRSPKQLPAHPITNSTTESEHSQKELEILKHQPYQLQPSQFVLSPSKDPVRFLTKAAPPPKPTLPNSYRFTRQSSCPSSPVPHSSVVRSPFRSDRPSSNPLSPSYGSNAVIITQDTRTSLGGVHEATEVPVASPVPFSLTRVMSPRAKRVIQAPRPSFSTKQAGIECQERRESLPASPTCSPSPVQWSGPLNEWSSSDQEHGSHERYTEAFRVLSPPPPPPMSPSWSERSLSPLRQEIDLKTNKQMQALIARNIINAARRKSSSPRSTVAEGFRPFTPPVGTKALPNSSSVPPWSPRIMSPLHSPTTVMARSPVRRYTTRSPTDSDVSIDSEDSGAKSPGLRGYSICPRGWNGSLRMKRGSLPTEAPCTS
ncbi:synaptopodin [Microcaecilia unicolor]|uniref:Synaptopodin n=1 Tax=Microcaecilia unicolor TaxID=1415580 RepID=A0A6P7YV63_9AMPH|nr:synaptopodin [Microcaecilia unicolor]XP_030067180.1 synaptopodin [Microcaecilia unicolor]XP_030067181.1 synaptopodin [Microcaecilia unicolor]XP_030067182.1 synaptopodin [Microcaecilia unicolor]